MFHITDKVVYAMASLRFISGLVELTGCLLMLYYGTAQRALQVNGLLALVGPLVLVSVSALGIAGIADGVSIGRIAMVVIGVAFILFATRF